MTPMEIDVHAVQAKRDAAEPFLLLDCREQNEWDFAHIDGAVLIPMSEISNRLPEVAQWQDRPIIVYCHLGVRSLHVAHWLRQQGLPNVHSMAGGIDQWSLAIDPGVQRY